jgi:sec-independent protein translocase protein TatC
MSFALFLPLGFGLAFQLPLVMLGLHRFGVISVDTFTSQWRIAVLIISFLAMILTPADPYSMVGLGAPLIVLYFFGILLCRYMPQGAGIGAPAIDPQ